MTRKLFAGLVAAVALIGITLMEPVQEAQAGRRHGCRGHHHRHCHGWRARRAHCNSYCNGYNSYGGCSGYVHGDCSGQYAAPAPQYPAPYEAGRPVAPPELRDAPPPSVREGAPPPPPPPIDPSSDPSADNRSPAPADAPAAAGEASGEASAEIAPMGT
jgi:hypothetical protein